MGLVVVLTFKCTPVVCVWGEDMDDDWDGVCCSGAAATAQSAAGCDSQCHPPPVHWFAELCSVLVVIHADDVEAFNKSVVSCIDDVDIEWTKRV